MRNLDKYKGVIPAFYACSYTNSIRTALSIVLKNEPNHL